MTRAIELSQLGSALGVDESTGKIGINGLPESAALFGLKASSTSELSDSSGIYNQSNPAFLQIKNATDDISDPECGIIFQPRNSANGSVAIYAKRTSSYISDLIFRFRTASSSSSEALRITSAGNVGIGTNNPSNKLHVSGVARFNNSTNNLLISTNDGEPFIYVEQNAALAFGTNSSEQARLTTSGEFYIGSRTAAGQGKLFVNDSSAAGLTRVHVRNAVSTGTAETYYNLDGTKFASVGLENGSLVLKNSSSSTPEERLRITSSGLVSIPVSGNLQVGAAGSPETDSKVYVANTGGNAYIQVKGADSTGVVGLKFGRNSVANRAGIDWSAATDKLTIRTGGTDPRVTVTNGGNVGIGSADPYARLDVFTTNYPAAKFNSSYTTSSKEYTSILLGSPNTNQGFTLGQLYDTVTPSAGYFHITPYGLGEGENFSIKHNGNVGIGTNNPLVKLDVRGGAYFGSDNTGTTYVTKAFSTSHDAANRGASVRFGMQDGSFAGMEVQTLEGSNSSFNSQTVVIRTHNGAIVGDYPSIVARYDGYVGIGTTDIYSKVQIVTGNSVPADNGNIFTISSGDGTNGNLVNKLNFGVSSTNNYAWIQSVKPGTNVYPLLLNPNGGNVGIGSTNPGAKLDVQAPGSSSRQDLARFRHDGQTDLVIQGQWGSQDIGGANGTLLYNSIQTLALRSGSSGNAHFVLRNSGNIGIGTDNPSRKLHVNGPTKIFENNHYPPIVYENRFYHVMKGKVINTYNNSGTNYNLVRCIKSTNIQYFVEVIARSVNATNSNASISVGYAMVRWLGGNFVTSTIHQNLTPTYNAAGGAMFTIGWVADGNNYILRATSTGTGYYSTLFDVKVHNRDAGYVDFFDAPVFDG